MTTEREQSALMRVLKATLPLAPQITYYATALCSVALLYGADLEAALAALAGGVGINTLSEMLKRILAGEEVSDQEIRRQVQSAIADSQIADQMAHSRTQAMIGRLFRRHDVLRVAVQQNEVDILVRLTEQAQQHQALAAVLRGDMALLREEVKKLATRAQADRIIRLLGGEEVGDTPAVTLQPEHVNAYLGVLREQCGRLETRPYRQLSELRGAPPCLSLLGEAGRAGVYIPLRFDLHPRRAGLEWARPARGLSDEVEHELEPDRARTDVALTEVLSEEGHLVFIGAAGCGKTTVLRLVAAVLAEQDPALAHQSLALAADPLPLPVWVALRDWEHACRTRPESYWRDPDGLLRFIDDHFSRWHPGCVPAGFLSGLVRAGRAWLLLDALDEVADFDHRVAVRQAIEQLAGRFPGNRLLVTARVAAYASVDARLDDRFHLATVRDLTREQWAPMMERLYAGLEADSGVAAERARRLIARVDVAGMLHEMVKTPLMVWTATLIHYANRELPEQRAELYNAYVEVLLGERLHEAESAEPAQALRDDRWSRGDRLHYLSYAAYQMHRRAEAGRADRRREALVVVDEQELVREILAPFMADYLGLPQRQARQDAADWLALMAERSGLLYPHAEGYSLGDHLTVQEFLAARYLVHNLRGTPDWRPFLETCTGQSWWREVYLLMAGYLLQWPEQVRRFLLDELGRLPGDSDLAAYGLAWAGRALLEIPPHRVGWHANVASQLAQRLVQVLWRNPPTTAVAARVEAGEVLGRLGDPRFPGDLCLPEFIHLPGGRGWMGSDPAEMLQLGLEKGKEWYEDETPRHQVELSPFALARYPTTNAMVACFLQDGGYADRRWWVAAIADRRWADGQISDFAKSRDRPAYWEDVRWNGSNQPVVGVTWYEADAYCRWLTHRLRQRGELGENEAIRLPTEAERERAAAGAAGRHYPWGDDWEPARANSKELNLERTTPVGIFPDGASAEGLLDLAGNVFEWCSDWFDGKTYHGRADHVAGDPTGPPSGTYRVLRGGAWYNDRNRVRCAYRIWTTPIDRLIYLGFRVARGSLV